MMPNMYECEKLQIM